MNLTPGNPWRGIYAAMLTPLKKDETLDEKSTVKLVDKLMNQKLAGLYICGSTGEAFGLDDEARARAYRIAVDIAKGRGRIIAHVGGAHTRRAIALAESAADAGADAVSAIAPYGHVYGFEEVREYYSAIARNSSLPLIIYHLPKFSGYSLTSDQMAELLFIDNVIGLKYTEYDMYTLERIINRFPDKAIFNGADESLLPALAIGAIGAIGSNYNVIPGPAVAVTESFWKGDIEGARRAQAVINHCVDVLFSTPQHLRAFKVAAANILGLPGMVVSPAPGSPPAPELVERLQKAFEEALKEYPLI